MKIVTLSLLQYLQDNGLGVLDHNLFWEKLGLGLDGLYITDLGTNQNRGLMHRITYEMFSRDKDDLVAFTKLQQVANFLQDSYEVCRLPAVPQYGAEMIKNVTIMPPSAITNAGEDTNGHIIYSLNGSIIY